MATLRVAAQGRQQWFDVWCSDLRMTYGDGTAVTVEMASNAPLRLLVRPAQWVLAIIRFLAFDEILEIG